MVGNQQETEADGGEAVEAQGETLALLERSYY